MTEPAPLSPEDPPLSRTPLVASRELPPGDYTFAIVGSDLLPAMVLKGGLFWSRALVFKPYDGTKLRRLSRRHLVDLDTANALLAFKKDPMALLHMEGEPHQSPPPPRRDPGEESTT